jgi:hypothetical protein
MVLRMVPPMVPSWIPDGMPEAEGGGGGQPTRAPGQNDRHVVARGPGLEAGDRLAVWARRRAT